MAATTIRRQARNFAQYALEELRETGEPYNYRDALPQVLTSLKAAIAEDDASLDEVIEGLCDGALKNADRDMTSAQISRIERSYFGESQTVFDYDPDEVLVLGDGLRIRADDARFEHWNLNHAIKVQNFNAQVGAFQIELQQHQAIITALQPLGPEATTADIRHSAQD